MCCINNHFYFTQCCYGIGIIICSSLKFIKLKLRHHNWFVTEIANALSGIWPQVIEPRTYTFPPLHISDFYIVYWDHEYVWCWANYNLLACKKHRCAQLELVNGTETAEKNVENRKKSHHGMACLRPTQDSIALLCSAGSIPSFLCLVIIVSQKMFAFTHWAKGINFFIAYRFMTSAYS